LGLELVENKADKRQGYTGIIPDEFAVKGFYGILLNEEMHERTTGLLTGQMDYKLIREQGNRLRLSPESNAGNFVDISLSPDSYRSRSGSGTIHHVAFATANDQTQLEVREKLVKSEISVTPVIDRQYFHSIYFREPGGVLFEVATSDMGFTFDEPMENLGDSLTLPVWQEINREKIEQNLVPVEFNSDKFKI
jgi:glyoxalase family protein